MSGLLHTSTTLLYRVLLHPLLRVSWNCCRWASDLGCTLHPSHEKSRICSLELFALVRKWICSALENLCGCRVWSEDKLLWGVIFFFPVWLTNIQVGSVSSVKLHKIRLWLCFFLCITRAPQKRADIDISKTAEEGVSGLHLDKMMWKFTKCFFLVSGDPFISPPLIFLSLSAPE